MSGGGSAPGPARGTFAHESAIELLLAMVAHASAVTPARVLAIKGRGLSHQGLRPATQVSSDVDVLVSPSDIAPFVATFRSWGWIDRPQGEVGEAVHSISLMHPQWGIDLDVHRFFPGIFQDPQVAFDFLWAGQESFEVAGATVAIPGPVEHALVVLLHAFRGPTVRVNRAAEVERAIGFLRTVPAETVRLAVSRLQCGYALRSIEELRNVMPTDSFGNSTQRLEWRLRSMVPGRTGKMIFQISRATGKERWRLLRAALFLPKEQVLLEHPELRDQESPHTGRIRARRIAALVRSWPRLVRALFSK